jgi:enoyl-CoA hydratase/carnithine racemase
MERPAYFDVYETIAFDRTPDGILTIRFHSDGRPVVYASAHHNDWVNAFYDISADRDNKVVIITGTGDEFIAVEEWDRPTDKVVYWDQIYWEAKRVLKNLLDIEVPVIGAVNGPATVHAEIALLSDITLASENASFRDAPHVPNGVVCGDGVQIVWQELLGPNRGKYFLLTGQTLSARDALQLGIVNEVLPRDALMPRAMEHARQLMEVPELTRRYSRVALNHRMKRLLHEGLGYGLALEGMSIMSQYDEPVDGPISSPPRRP